MEIYDCPPMLGYEIEKQIKKSDEQLEKMNISELHKHLKDLDSEIEQVTMKIKGPRSDHWIHDWSWQLDVLGVNY